MIHGTIQVLVIWLAFGLPLGIAVGLAIAWGDGPPRPEIGPSGDRLGRSRTGRPCARRSARMRLRRLGWWLPQRGRAPGFPDALLVAITIEALARLGRGVRQ